eukprot:ANDGO_02946.mRNA.1 hypothetical protein
MGGSASPMLNDPPPVQSPVSTPLDDYAARQQRLQVLFDKEQEYRKRYALASVVRAEGGDSRAAEDMIQSASPHPEKNAEFGNPLFLVPDFKTLYPEVDLEPIRERRALIERRVWKSLAVVHMIAFWVLAGFVTYLGLKVSEIHEPSRLSLQSMASQSISSGKLTTEEISIVRSSDQIATLQSTSGSSDLHIVSAAGSSALVLQTGATVPQFEISTAASGFEISSGGVDVMRSTSHGVVFPGDVVSKSLSSSVLNVSSTFSAAFFGTDLHALEGGGLTQGPSTRTSSLVFADGTLVVSGSNKIIFSVGTDMVFETDQTVLSTVRLKGFQIFDRTLTFLNWNVSERSISSSLSEPVSLSAASGLVIDGGNGPVRFSGSSVQIDSISFRKLLWDDPQSPLQILAPGGVVFPATAAFSYTSPNSTMTFDFHGPVLERFSASYSAVLGNASSHFLVPSGNRSDSDSFVEAGIRFTHTTFYLSSNVVLRASPSSLRISHRPTESSPFLDLSETVVRCQDFFCNSTLRTGNSNTTRLKHFFEAAEVEWSMSSGFAVSAVRSQMTLFHSQNPASVIAFDASGLLRIDKTHVSMDGTLGFHQNGSETLHLSPSGLRLNRTLILSTSGGRGYVASESGLTTVELSNGGTMVLSASNSVNVFSPLKFCKDDCTNISTAIVVNNTNSRISSSSLHLDFLSGELSALSVSARILFNHQGHVFLDSDWSLCGRSRQTGSLAPLSISFENSTFLSSRGSIVLSSPEPLLLEGSRKLHIGGLVLDGNTLEVDGASMVLDLQNASVTGRNASLNFRAQSLVASDASTGTVWMDVRRFSNGSVAVSHVAHLDVSRATTEFSLSAADSCPQCTSGGRMLLSAGSFINASVRGSGGSLYFAGGSSHNGTGGDVCIQGGSSATETAGSIILSAGNANSAVLGNINFSSTVLSVSATRFLTPWFALNSSGLFFFDPRGSSRITLDHDASSVSLAGQNISFSGLDTRLSSSSILLVASESFALEASMSSFRIDRGSWIMDTPSCSITTSNLTLASKSIALLSPKIFVGSNATAVVNIQADAVQLLSSSLRTMLTLTEKAVVVAAGNSLLRLDNSSLFAGVPSGNISFSSTSSRLSLLNDLYISTQSLTVSPSSSLASLTVQWGSDNASVTHSRPVSTSQAASLTAILGQSSLSGAGGDVHIFAGNGSTAASSSASAAGGSVYVQAGAGAQQATGAAFTLGGGYGGDGGDVIISSGMAASSRIRDGNVSILTQSFFVRSTTRSSTLLDISTANQSEDRVRIGNMAAGVSSPDYTDLIEARGNVISLKGASYLSMIAETANATIVIGQSSSSSLVPENILIRARNISLMDANGTPSVTVSTTAIDFNRSGQISISVPLLTVSSDKVSVTSGAAGYVLTSRDPALPTYLALGTSTSATMISRPVSTGAASSTVLTGQTACADCGNGGNFIVRAGYGHTLQSAAAGGSLILEAGNGFGDAAGGNVAISAGDSSSTSTGGSILLRAGGSASASYSPSSTGSVLVDAHAFSVRSWSQLTPFFVVGTMDADPAGDHVLIGNTNSSISPSATDYTDLVYIRASTFKTLAGQSINLKTEDTVSANTNIEIGEFSDASTYTNYLRLRAQSVIFRDRKLRTSLEIDDVAFRVNRTGEVRLDAGTMALTSTGTFSVFTSSQGMIVRPSVPTNPLLISVGPTQAGVEISMPASVSPAHGSDLKIYGQSACSNCGDGGSISLAAGEASSNNASLTGGSLNLYAGLGRSQSGGGWIRLFAADSISGRGGSIHLRTGLGNTVGSTMLETHSLTVQNHAYSDPILAVHSSDSESFGGDRIEIGNSNPSISMVDASYTNSIMTRANAYTATVGTLFRVLTEQPFPAVETTVEIGDTNVTNRYPSYIKLRGNTTTLCSNRVSVQFEGASPMFIVGASSNAPTMTFTGSSVEFSAASAASGLALRSTQALLFHQTSMYLKTASAAGTVIQIGVSATDAASSGTETVVIRGTSVQIWDTNAASTNARLDISSSNYVLRAGTSGAVSVVGDLLVSGKVKESGDALIPANSVIMFKGIACPAGYAELTEARGRAVFGMPTQTSGAWADYSPQQGSSLPFPPSSTTRSFSVPGQTISVSLSHTHGGVSLPNSNCCGGGSQTVAQQSYSGSTSATVAAASTTGVPVHNIVPGLYLLVCYKL